MSTSEKKEINQFDANGWADGWWEKYYWSNGQLSYKGNFINGKKDGLWEDYHDNGQLRYKGSYIKGEEVGWWEEYFRNGRLVKKYFYLNL